MATFRGTVYSKTLGMDTCLNIVTPRCKSEDYDSLPKVVYLLHGLMDNADAWLDNASLRELSTDYNSVFVMPEVQRCFYTDMAYGLDYFSYIADELPEIVKGLFRVSEKREDTFVFGLSMGGYGALKLAMLYPERFAACGGFSTVCSPKKALTLDGIDISEKEQTSVFGKNLSEIDKADLSYISEKFSECSDKPKIYMSCGKKDFLHSINVTFEKRLTDLNIPHIYEEWDGIHNWKFWRESLDKALSIFLKDE